MKKFILLLLIALPMASIAQREIEEDAPHNFKDRVYFGGGLGLGGGTGYFSVSINPIIGYMITPKFSAGTGINYQYLGYTDYKPAITINQYGISPF